MAEPTAAKVTLTTALGLTSIGALAPLVAEWAALIVCAGFGAFLGLSMASEKLSGWWRPARHVLLSVGCALIATPLAVTVGLRIVGSDVERADALPVVAVLIAAFWRNILAIVPSLISKYGQRP